MSRSLAESECPLGDGAQGQPSGVDILSSRVAIRRDRTRPVPLPTAGRSSGHTRDRIVARRCFTSRMVWGGLSRGPPSWRQPESRAQKTIDGARFPGLPALPARDTRLVPPSVSGSVASGNPGLPRLVSRSANDRPCPNAQNMRVDGKPESAQLIRRLKFVRR